MESRAAWDAENRKAMEAIAASVAALQRTVATNQADPPASSYGPYVDALARKAVSWARLAEVARVEAKNAALKTRLVAGYPQRPSAAPLLSDPRGML